MKMRNFSSAEKRVALQKVETALEQPLFKKEVTDSFLDNSVEYFKKWHKPKLRVALETLRLLKQSQGGKVTPEVQERLRAIKSTMRAGHDVEPHENIEVCGHKIKVVASNIRRNDLAWENFTLLETGVGHEGDVVLAEILDPTGSTKKIENIYGRDAALVKGDKILAVFGHRHTGTSEYGEIPKEGWDLTKKPEVDLLAHGGIVGEAHSIPNRMGSRPSKLKILGLLAKNNIPLNLRDLFPPWEDTLKPSAPLIAFCGTGAEVGKTTAASAFVRELRARGMKVAATKLAGTGRYRDLLALRDAGADTFYDFPDIGLPSTYTTPERYIPAIKTLINKLNEGEPDIIVAEFGGDIIEANIPTFFHDPDLRSTVKSIVHSSGDIMGMKGSLEYYRKWGLNVPIFLSQPKDRNLLGTKVRVDEHVGLPLFDTLNDVQVSNIVSQIEDAILQQEGL